MFFNKKSAALELVQNGYLASGSSDTSIKIWNIETGQLKFKLIGHSDAVNSLEYLQDVYMASASSDNTIKIWNIRLGELVRTLSGHAGEVLSVESLPSGAIISRSLESKVIVWNATTGNVLQNISSFDYLINSLEVFNNNRKKIQKRNNKFSISFFNIANIFPSFI